MRLSRNFIKLGILLVPALLLPLLSGTSFGKKKEKVVEPPFLYQAGTEKIGRGCGGRLEVHKDGLAFRCPGGEFNFPYTNVVLMQYRPNLSDEVVGLKIGWNYPPELPRVNRNKYFTVVSKDGDKFRAVVLRVDEKDMQPYFAEIELQSGKTVQEYRSYEEFQDGHMK